MRARVAVSGGSVPATEMGVKDGHVDAGSGLPSHGTEDVL